MDFFLDLFSELLEDFYHWLLLVTIREATRMKRNGKNGRRISRNEEAIEEMSPLKIISFVDCFNWLATKKRGAESRQGGQRKRLAKEHIRM